jgi:hypothetical protein
MAAAATDFSMSMNTDVGASQKHKDFAQVS